MILALGEDTVPVEGSVFIVDDKWSDTESQTFLHHNQAADAAVVILEGVDLFKTDMEFQDPLNSSEILFVGLAEGGEFLADLCWGNAFLGIVCAEHSRLQFYLSVGIGAVCKDLVQVLDENRCQIVFNVIDYMSHSFEMIDGFDDVIHLCRLKGCGDAVLAIA